MILLDYEIRCKELSEFFGMSLEDVKTFLNKGFFPHHANVAIDWNKYNPVKEDEITAWYSNTDTYIWELTTYHLKEFEFGPYFGNVMLTVKNIINRYSPGFRCIDLGGGIGDLAIYLAMEGKDVTYYDIPGRTMDFAKFHYNYWKNFSNKLNVRFVESNGFPESMGDGEYDTIIGTDFFEHLVDVEGYVKKCHELLKDSGILIAYNAFGEGSPNKGNSIPMHLSVNDKYVNEWNSLLDKIGFEKIENNVYKRR